MVAYGIAKARAMANRTDWNERTEITKAVIIWFDADYEYELEIENEDRMDNEEFTAWVEENAESLAKADAESLHTVCEEIDSIDFTEKEIDDDALFDEEYENACEFEWVTPHGVGRCPKGKGDRSVRGGTECRRDYPFYLFVLISQHKVYLTLSFQRQFSKKLVHGFFKKSLAFPAEICYNIKLKWYTHAVSPWCSARVCNTPFERMNHTLCLNIQKKSKPAPSP